MSLVSLCFFLRSGTVAGFLLLSLGSPDRGIRVEAIAEDGVLVLVWDVGRDPGQQLQGTEGIAGLLRSLGSLC